MAGAKGYLKMCMISMYNYGTICWCHWHHQDKSLISLLLQIYFAQNGLVHHISHLYCSFTLNGCLWMFGWILFDVYLYPLPLVLIVKFCTVMAYPNMILHLWRHHHIHK
jgi:hypothetical protein